MRRINNILLLFLAISIIGVVSYFIPDKCDQFEDIYKNIVLPVSLGYIMSYILFYMTVLIPQKEQDKKDNQTLCILYDILQRRLTDCLARVEMHFGFTWVDDIDLLVGIYSSNVSDEKKAAINNLISLMEKEDLFDIYCERLNKDKKKFGFDDETVKLYDDSDFKTILSEIDNVLLPQLFIYEKDQIKKNQLLNLYHNISDSSRKVNSQKQACAGVLYKHLVSFVKCAEKSISTLC